MRSRRRARDPSRERVFQGTCYMLDEETTDITIDDMVDAVGLATAASYSAVELCALSYKPGPQMGWVRQFR